MRPTSSTLVLLSLLALASAQLQIQCMPTDDDATPTTGAQPAAGVDSDKIMCISPGADAECAHGADSPASGAPHFAASSFAAGMPTAPNGADSNRPRRRRLLNSGGGGNSTRTIEVLRNGMLGSGDAFGLQAVAEVIVSPLFPSSLPPCSASSYSSSALSAMLACTGASASSSSFIVPGRVEGSNG
ncbi:hypothetical protein C8J57DRAFT_1530928 [Mycena rebaudengoi]|nr:hypothetical protein C8J57DRAFT_1530928 [Mycena rebaudengoi]